MGNNSEEKEGSPPREGGCVPRGDWSRRESPLESKGWHPHVPIGGGARTGTLLGRGRGGDGRI